MTTIPTTKAPAAPIPALFDSLGIKQVSRKDQFSIEYASGFLTATVKHHDGSVHVVRRSIGNNGFSEVTTFDPNKMSRDDRDKLISRLSKDGFSQSEIARRIGFSQATVSNALRKQKST
ncbi:MAG: helix-turn-helix domain-containing protein [Acidithiobacillus sp.]|nr:helix-turn-helix domain-containing protein [Acidithiobacillus sp.]